MLNRQKLFDDAWRQIFKQGGPSMDASGTKCRYRGADGAMCNFGPQIPDLLYYDENMEGKTAGDLLCSFPSVVKNLGLQKDDGGYLRSGDLVFVDELQDCHDDPARGARGMFMTRYCHAMKRFGSHYQLVVPEEIIKGAA